MVIENDSANYLSGGAPRSAFVRDQAIPEAVRAHPTGPPRHAASLDLRELNRLLVEADAEVEDFERVADLLGEARRLLEKAPYRRPLYWESSAPVGHLNVLAPPLVAEPAEDPHVFRLRGTLGTGYEGQAGLLHGGVLAAILDTCFASAVVLDGGPGAFTGTLTVRYEQPTPLHTELVFEAWNERVEGRKVFGEGRVLAGDVVCVTATAVMIRPR